MKTQIFRQTLTLSALTTLALAVTAPAFAEDSSGWYLGGSVGQSQANIAKQEIVADLLSAGLVTTSFRKDETDLGYKLLAGYRWNQYFALEGGYFDLGEFSYNATTNPAGSKKGELGFRGWNLDLVGMVPMSERTALFARIGAHRGEADVVFTDSGAVTTADPRSSKTDTNYKAGVGFQYSVTDALALRLEAERYRMNDSVGNKGDLDLISAGFVYYFSGKSSSTSERSEQPAASDLVVVPLPATTEQYCTLLDIQFEIAQDKIERAEQEKLAVVATFLERYPKTSAVIEGHSDNVGRASRNLKLSQGRAESVKQYLIDKHQKPTNAAVPSYAQVVGLVLGADADRGDGEARASARSTRALAPAHPARLRPETQADRAVRCAAKKTRRGYRGKPAATGDRLLTRCVGSCEKI